MSLICCIPAGIPHISFLKQPEELKREVHAAPHFAYQPSSCWQMLDLIKTAAPRQDRGGSPPGQDQSWDNLPGNERSTIVCRKYQNHHNHLSLGDLYLRSSSPRISAATFTTFQTVHVPSTWLCWSKQHKPPEALCLFEKSAISIRKNQEAINTLLLVPESWRISGPGGQATMFTDQVNVRDNKMTSDCVNMETEWCWVTLSDASPSWTDWKHMTVAGWRDARCRTHRLL